MSILPHRRYKESGVAWLGEVPEHWNILPLLAVGRERDEKNIGMAESNLLSLSYGRIVRKDIDTNEGLLPESFETYQIVYPGDIVFRLTDLQNDKRSLRTAIVEERGIITSAYLALQPFSANPQFLNYLFRAYDLRKVFYAMGSGVRQSMKYEDVKRMEMLLPPMEEQAAIVTFLEWETEKIDALIEQQQRLVALLKEKRQAVISNAFTQLEGSTAIRKLSHFTSDIGDGLHGTPQYDDDSNFYFINGNNLVDGLITCTESTRTVSKEEASKYGTPLDESTLLLSINGTIGNAALYHGELVMLGKSAAYIRCDSNLMREYLFFYLQSSAIKSYFERVSTGTTISNLSLQSVRNLPIRVPSIPEQQALVNRLRKDVDDFKRVMAEAGSVIDLLQERRSALISAAVTGKIDVRGLTASTAEVTEAAYEPA